MARGSRKRPEPERSGKSVRPAGSAAKRRAEQLFAEGVRCQGAAQPAHAEQLFKKCVTENPEHAGAYHQIALLELGRGESENALASMHRAVELAPREPISHNNLGNLMSDLGRPQEALAQYRIAIRLTPDYVSAHYNLGKALQKLGQAAPAVASLERALSLAPGEAQILASLGAALLEAGRAHAAREHCEEAVARNPNLAEAHNNLGLVELADGAFDAAAKHFRRALDLDERFAVAAANLTRTRRFGTQDASEVERIERLLQHHGLAESIEVDLRFALGKVYDDTECYERAYAHYRRANALKARTLGFDAVAHSAWADRVAKVFDAEFFAARSGFGVASERPVFIVGMPRSGTSLVEQILASHPRVFGAGELPDIALIRAGIAAEHDYPAAMTSLSRAGVEQAAGRYLRSIEGKAGLGFSRVTDKTPANCLDLGLIALLLPGAKVVHCRRDPRDTGLSIFFRHFTAGHEYAYRLADIAAYYRTYERLMRHWREVGLPVQTLELSYEELIAEPEVQIRRLLDFCALEWNPNCLAFHQADRTVYTASTWQVRQPLYNRAVARWKHYERGLGAFADLEPWRTDKQPSS